MGEFDDSELQIDAAGIIVKHMQPWGTFELARGYQIEGFLIFDVPKGLLLGTLFWDEVEYIPVDFVNYLEN